MSEIKKWQGSAIVLGVVILLGALVAFGLHTGAKMEKKRPKPTQEWHFGRVVLHTEGGSEWIQNGNDYPIFVQMVTVVRPKNGEDSVLIWDIPIQPFQKTSCVIKPETVFMLYRDELKGRVCFGVIIPEKGDER